MRPDTDHRHTCVHPRQHNKGYWFHSIWGADILGGLIGAGLVDVFLYPGQDSIFNRPVSPAFATQRRDSGAAALALAQSRAEQCSGSADI